jgi:hypothetical protein
MGVFFNRQSAYLCHGYKLCSICRQLVPSLGWSFSRKTKRSYSLSINFRSLSSQWENWNHLFCRNVSFFSALHSQFRSVCHGIKQTYLHMWYPLFKLNGIDAISEITKSRIIQWTEINGSGISFFPLWTFHSYVAAFQQHMHMEYISLSWYVIPQFVVPIIISLI